MISTTKNNVITGIVIKKFSYKEHHEVVHVLTEHGYVESFFYENVNKNKKKSKLSIPCLVNISFFRTSGMNKIITLDIEDYYGNIIYDIHKSSYVSNMLEILTIVETNAYHYSIMENSLYLLNYKNVDEQLINIYFICKILKYEGFNFKYIQTKKEYQGYSFITNMFVDYVEHSNKFYKLENKLVKLIYILSSNNIDIVEKISLEIKEYKVLLEFLNIIMLTYVGIETKSYKKIQEIEELLYNFERKRDNE